MALLDLLLNGPTPMGLSLTGEPGPTFESEGDAPYSTIQAYVEGRTLVDSDDLYNGIDIGPVLTFIPDSQPPVSVPDNFIGLPYYPSLGGTYTDKGPAEGIY